MRELARRLTLATGMVITLASIAGSGCISPSVQAPPDPEDGNRNPELASHGRRMPVPGHRRQSVGPDVPGSDVDPHVVAYRDYRDPLMLINRAVFKMNDFVYRYALIPVSEGYLWITPDPVERSIGNFFQNLREPLYAVNHLLQLKPGRMTRSSLRLIINSTLGGLGLYDTAAAWFGLAREETGFNETLARYGFGYGFYLVLPILGPSDLRDATGRVGRYFVSPIPHVTDEPVTTGVRSFDTLQDFAPLASDYRTLHNHSEDPYLFFRNLYLQGVQRDVDHQP